MKAKAVFVNPKYEIGNRLGWQPINFQNWLAVPPDGSAEVRQGVLWLRQGERVVAVDEFAVDYVDEPPAPRAKERG